MLYSLANEKNILHSDSYTLASSVTTISILISIHKEQNWWTVDWRIKIYKEAKSIYITWKILTAMSEF